MHKATFKNAGPFKYDRWVPSLFAGLITVAPGVFDAELPENGNYAVV